MNQTMGNETNGTRRLVFRATIFSYLLLGGAATSAGDTTYYVDSIDGHDDHKGISAQSVWKSLAKLDGIEFKPGDRILLRAGCRFAGSLHPRGAGVEGKPIVIDRYGDGADPVVAGQGKVENTIRLHDQQYWEIRNLTVTNTDGGCWDDQRRLVLGNGQRRHRQ